MIAAAGYVGLRRSISRRYHREALDDLVRSLDVTPARAVSSTLSLDLDDAAVAISAGERIARHARIDRDTCLFRALARYGLLRRAGLRPRFVMAIDEHDPDRGHAWVELDDRPFLEARLPSYRRTLEHPARDV